MRTAEPDAPVRDATGLRFELLSCAGSQLVAVTHRPAGPAARASLILLPPWGEEENRSRAMLAALARRLAGEGVATMVLNLSGTGESWPMAPPREPRQWARELQEAADLFTRRIGGPAPHLLACREMAVWCASRVLPSLPSDAFARVFLWDPPSAPAENARALRVARPSWAREARIRRGSRVVVLSSPPKVLRPWTGREGRVNEELVSWAAARIAGALTTQETATPGARSGWR